MKQRKKNKSKINIIHYISNDKQSYCSENESNKKSKGPITSLKSEKETINNKMKKFLGETNCLKGYEYQTQIKLLSEYYPYNFSTI